MCECHEMSVSVAGETDETSKVSSSQTLVDEDIGVVPPSCLGDLFGFFGMIVPGF